MKIDFTESKAALLDLCNDLAVIKCDIEDDNKPQPLIVDDENINTCCALRKQCKEMICELERMETN